MFLILLIIMAIIFSIWFSINTCFTIWGTIGSSIATSCLTCFIALLIFFLGGNIISAFCEVEYVEDSTYEITALKDNSFVSGHTYLLSSGHFNDKMQYVYLIENENGNFEMKTIETKYAEVAISNEVVPHVVIKRAKFTNEFMNFFLSFNGAPVWNPDRYIIYVPEGTIDYSYNIDLE